MAAVSEKLNEADAILRANGVVDPRREASSLLALALNRDKAFLIAHPEYVLDRVEEALVDEYVQRRASHEPYQYISGIQEFYGLDFKVTPDVLIPRPETEMVVARAVEILDGVDNPRFCEVGIGSGCISISVLFHVKAATAVGLDISPGALEVAYSNAGKHRVSDRLTLLESDVFAALHEERFDLIVSNPPYVPARQLEGLQSEVRDFEPHIALIGGDDGLSVVRRVICDSPRLLRPKGHLLLEIGFDQSEKVAAMFDTAVWEGPEFYPDLQGIPRLVAGRRI